MRHYPDNIQQQPAASAIPWQLQEASGNNPVLKPVDNWQAFASASDKGSRRSRILVVDDERLIADTLAHILNLSDFVAQAVYSGEAALEILPSLCPDIVLTDVRMPGKDGIATGIEIRKRCPHTRVVLFSGQASANELIENVRQDGHGFELWSKPIHPRELVKRLREF